MSDLDYTPRCPVCGTTDRPGMGHACSTVPAIGTGPLDTPFRKCAGCDQLKAELAALKERLRGLAAGMRMDAERYRADPSGARACVSLDGYAADLERVIGATASPTEPAPGQS